MITEQSTEILALIGQAIFLVRGDLISYTNPAAVTLLGSDCRGKKLSQVLGAEIAASQSSDFVANAVIRGKSYIVRSSRQNGFRVVILSEPAADCVFISDSFISAMRSSMMLLSMSAELCRAKAGENSSRELLSALASLNKSVAIASRMVGNVSAARDILRGELSFSPGNIDLSLLCRSFIDTLEELIPDVQIEADLPDSCILSADPKLIMQLLANLFSNSITHGKSQNVHLRLIGSGDTAILSVSDDGCGIPSEELCSVFERYRSDIELMDMSRGSGFGLTVVRGIAEKHGGTLLLESREGRGTTARVSLRRNIRNLTLRSTEAGEPDMKELLVWAADCLSESCYTEKFMD